MACGESSIGIEKPKVWWRRRGWCKQGQVLFYSARGWINPDKILK